MPPLACLSNDCQTPSLVYTQALLTDGGNIVHQWSHSPGAACDEGEVETLRHCYQVCGVVEKTCVGGVCQVGSSICVHLKVNALQDLGGRTMQHIPLRVGNVVQGPPG